ncbi:hypothetical protein K7H93_15695 [Citromicrobium bathyomarinum]|nr:hypothetical protein [Citromicrobium bathyomarinum]
MNDIANHLDSFFAEALNSEQGRGLENDDGFLLEAKGHQCSTLRTRVPDAHGISSEIVIDLFAEGRASVTATWYEGKTMDVGNREARDLYFSGSETASNVAGRVLSAMLDCRENEVAEEMRRFVEAKGRETGLEPAA